MRERGIGDRVRHHGGLLALSVPLVVGPQLIGGVFAWATLAIGLAIAFAALLIWWSSLHESSRAPVSRYLLVLWVPVLWTALQALPLDCAWVAAVAPQAAAQAQRTFQLLPGSPDACTVSFDPGGTRLEMLKGLALVVALLSGWMLALQGRRRDVLRLVGISTLAMAAVSLAHRLAAAERVFGIYEPRHAPPPIWGPLLNPNHLAAFLVMGVPVTLTLGLSNETREQRWLWFGASCLIASASILTLSRAGVGSLFMAGAVLCALLLRRRGTRTRRYKATFVTGATLAMAAAVAAYVSLGELAHEATSRNFEKLELIHRGLAFSLEHPWLGVGRGAFSAAFVSVAGGTQRFVYPESLPVQWASEWGYPVAILTFGVLGFAWLSAAWRARSLERMGALAGVAGIALHDVLDFALEMSGIAVAAATLFGAAVAARPDAGRKRRSARTVPAGPTLVAVCGACVVGTLVFGPQLLRTDMISASDRLQGSMALPSGRGASEELLHDALRAHPNEPSLTLLAAARAIEYGDPPALGWLNRTMELAPSWSAPHLLAGRWLMQRGHYQQALLEAREAETREAYASGALLCDVLAHAPDAELVLRAAPRKVAARRRFLGKAARCLNGHPEAVARLDAGWAKRDSTALEPRLRQAERAFRAGNEEAAIVQWRALIESHPEDVKPYTELGEAFLKAGRPGDALELVDRAENRWTSLPYALLELRARAHAAKQEAAPMRRAIAAMKGRAAGNARGLSEVLVLRSTLEEQLGNHGSALAALSEAATLDPREAVIRRLATLASRQGAAARAKQAYARLCMLRPGNEQYCSRVADNSTKP